MCPYEAGEAGKVDEAVATMFDVRGWKARPLLHIRYGRFDVRIRVDCLRRVIGNSQVDGESS